MLADGSPPLILDALLRVAFGLCEVPFVVPDNFINKNHGNDK